MIHQVSFPDSGVNESRLKMQPDRVSGPRARAEGREEGAILGQIRLCQQVFHEPLMSDEEFDRLAPGDQRRLAEDYQQRLNARLKNPG